MIRDSTNRHTLRDVLPDVYGIATEHYKFKTNPAYQDDHEDHKILRRLFMFNDFLQ